LSFKNNLPENLFLTPESFLKSLENNKIFFLLLYLFCFNVKYVVFGIFLCFKVDSVSLNLNLNKLSSEILETGYLTILKGAFLPKLLLTQREFSSRSGCVIKLLF
jgi:hypothetical protein